MKKLIIALVIGLCSTAYADITPTLGTKQAPAQVFTPDGSLGQLLTVYSTTIPMKNYAVYGIYAPSPGCKARTMATTAKGSNLLRTVPDGQWIIRGVSKKTPFLNLSGCTNAELAIQPQEK